MKNLENDTKKYSEITKEILEKLDDVFYPVDIFVPTLPIPLQRIKHLMWLIHSEVGRFSEEVRKIYLQEIEASDPIFSVINYRNDTNVYDIDNSEAFGVKSIWSYLEKYSALYIQH